MLDDNKKLCLNSGEIIKVGLGWRLLSTRTKRPTLEPLTLKPSFFTHIEPILGPFRTHIKPLFDPPAPLSDPSQMSDPMTMFFEAEDLEQASPATVSRVGMIFCETRNIGWAAVRNIWLHTLSEHCAAPEVKQLLVDLFDWLFPVMSYFVVKNCRMPTAMAAQELIFGHTRLLKCMLDFDDGVASDLPKVR